MSTNADALIDAGLRLSERIGFPQLDGAAVAAEASLQPADFDAAFASLENFVAALQQRFLDVIRNAMIAATSELSPGYERARLGAISYLDCCLSHRGLRQWLLQARSQYPAVAQGLQRQNQGYLLILPAEFTALRWPHPAAGARLFLAALQDISRIEHAPGRANSELRNALWQFLRTYDGR